MANNWLEDLWGMTRAGQRMETSKRGKLADELKLFAATDNPEEKAKIFAGIQSNPQFQALQERMGAAQVTGQQQPSVLSAEDQVANRGFSQFSDREASDYARNKGKYQNVIEQDPMVRGAIAHGKVKVAEDAYADDEMTPELASYFATTHKSIDDKSGFDFGKQPKKTAEGKDVKIFDRTGNVVGTQTNEGRTDLKFNEQGKVIDNRSLFSGATTSPAGKATVRPSGTETPPPIGEFFQQATETVPEEKTKKSFEEIGVETPDAMQILDEMDKALPDIDMHDEFENAQQDPQTKEMLDKLMQRWKDKKLSVDQLRKAFSMMQQNARQSLGIT